MNISKEMIAENKENYLGLLDSLKTMGVDANAVDDLKAFLVSSDFFTAPASTKFHGAYEGGLCDHSLAVYFNLRSLMANKHITDIPDRSVLICALLHDISKIDNYVMGVKNKKVYSQTGSKSDSNGRYDWVSVPGYESTDPSQRDYVIGNHEETSVFMITRFIQLDQVEYSAILNHMGGMSYDSNKNGVAVPYGKHKLAVLLHLADMIASYIDEA